MNDHSNEERWRAVVGYEGLYEVSNFGRIRSVDRHSYRRDWRSQIIAQNLNTAGGRQGARMYVCLCKEGIMRKILVHRLVADAFIPNPDPKRLTDVCHTDHNPRNNRVENLKWMTHRDNIRTSVVAGRWRRKVTDDQIKEIRRRADAGESQRSLAKEYGFAFGTINSIVCRRSWRHVV